MQGKITECWLAETEGIFPLIKRALLVIKRAWLHDADWLSTPALNWLLTSNRVWIINLTYKAQISTKCSSALNTDYIKYGSNNKFEKFEISLKKEFQKRIASEFDLNTVISS